MTTKTLEPIQAKTFEKFRTQALTFDDVLLVPAHSSVLAQRGQHRHPLFAQRLPEHPHRLLGDGHRD